MKEKIFEFSKKLNIEYVGIAPVMHYKELEERINSRVEKYGLSEFEEKNILLRTNPEITFDWAKSIIVCLFPYYTGEDIGANVSKYAKIPDYHKIAAKKLGKICAFIKEKTDAKLEYFADTGVLHDRYLAYLAGLGFFGLNTCLINEKYGSFFFIGYIVTDLELAPDKPIKKECVKCKKCVHSCPGHAIDGDFHINVQKCVSYITQLKKLTQEQRKILKNQEMVYGCDRCQEVCPYNQKPVCTPMVEFYEKKEPKLEKETLLNMSNKEFSKKYGDFAFSWRGKGTILKNFDK
ncbi:MAG: tRNA epoxyqueuosine(34) reductase QueG [Clostridia bacterium]|nr:tRNA epoxyqueuosine(34) reductase QueG [Clostridia bacterium]